MEIMIKPNLNDRQKARVVREANRFAALVSEDELTSDEVLSHLTDLLEVVVMVGAVDILVDRPQRPVEVTPDGVGIVPR